jgi:hypothetical protein
MWVEVQEHSTLSFASVIPNLTATVYDLPFVTGIAAERIAEAGLSDHISTQPGDFFADAKYPPDHDVILLSMIARLERSGESGDPAQLL